MRRPRQILDSLLYARLKPCDPLYLSNRTIFQRLGFATLLVIPGLAVGTVLAAMAYFHTSADLPKPAKSLTNAEIAARMLPTLNHDIRIDVNRDVQVLSAIVRHGVISGSVKNTTTRAIADAEVVFDLVNARGSGVGAVTCKFKGLPPGASTPFQNHVAQADAIYALVHEVHTQ